MAIIDIKLMVKCIRETQKRERDALICLSGMVGEGKSTLSIQIAKEYLGINTIEQFSNFCETGLFYNRAELLNAVVNTREQVIIVDEAINMLFRRDFMRGEQKELLRVMDVCRDHKHLFLFNIPSFFSLDSHTVQNRVKLWVYVFKQKYAHILKPISDNPFAIDVWRREVNYKICGSGLKNIPQSPNYVSSMTFDPLSPKEYEIYHAIKDQKKIVLDAELEDKKVEVPKDTKGMLIKRLHQANPSLTQADLARATKSTRSYVSEVFKNMGEPDETETK
jgi:hypothetical protein